MIQSFLWSLLMLLELVQQEIALSFLAGFVSGNRLAMRFIFPPVVFLLESLFNVYLLNLTFFAVVLLIRLIFSTSILQQRQLVQIHFSEVSLFVLIFPCLILTVDILASDFTLFALGKHAYHLSRSHVVVVVLKTLCYL